MIPDLIKMTETNQILNKCEIKTRTSVMVIGFMAEALIKISDSVWLEKVVVVESVLWFGELLWGSGARVEI